MRGIKSNTPKEEAKQDTEGESGEKSNMVKRWKVFFRSVIKFLIYGVFYPTIYFICRLRPVNEKKVLLLALKGDRLEGNLKMVGETLSRENIWDIHVHFLKEGMVSESRYVINSAAMLCDMATAKYVFLDYSCNVPGRVPIRKETVIVQLWHGCGAFKKFGLSTAELKYGCTRREQLKFPYYKYCDLVTVSSPEAVWAYEDATGLPGEKIQPLGVCRTDVFFQKDFLQGARERFLKQIPIAVGKKVILFAPTFRGDDHNARTSEHFSVEKFYEALRGEYILVVKHHPYVKNPPEIPEAYRNFAVDVTGKMNIEDLLCVADICISDYSSLVFEYSLFGRPMIFFAYDLEEYFDSRGFYYDYDELTPGPVCRTNREMLDYIRRIDELFDREEVERFRAKFMSACDGHSTERILQKVMGNARKSETGIEMRQKTSQEKLK